MLLRFSRSLGKAPAGFVITGVVTDGDSITFGTSATHGYPYYFTQNTGVATSNQGSPGADLVSLTSAYSSRIAPLYNSATYNACSIAAGSNDLAGSTSAATLETTIQSYASSARATGFKVAVASVIARSSIAGGQETQRGLYNTWLRANWNSFADWFIDFDSIPESQDPTNSTYFNSDQTHPKDALQTIMATKMQTALGL